MNNKNTLFRLNGKVQHYLWGGSSFIPQLLNIPNSNGQPFAEYWLGAHDNFPSELKDDGKKLNEYIDENPSVLGEKARLQFGRLPYLLKVLDVKDMLSIQVHPSKEAAAIEFEKENKKGISLTASNRNYKDNNHKPELMVALSDFWLLHGFRAGQDMISSISGVDEFSFMLPLFEEGGYQKLYKTLMEMDQQKVNEILQRLLERIIPKYEKNILNKNDANFWAARAALTFNEPGKADRGIFSVYLLNLVHLKPGEAIFQDAGILHAYLEGQNMEIMANSDNVLRGGLTPKHIDVDELMKHVTFAAVTPHIIRGTRINEVEEAYVSPAPDFQLNRLLISKGNSASIRASTTEVFIVMEGRIEIKEDGNSLMLKRGEAAVAFAGAALNLTAIENSIVYRALLPQVISE